MIAASAGVKVMVATKPVDFRNGADGRPEIVFPARLFLQTETGEWEQAAAVHTKCALSKAKMANGQLAANVLNFAVISQNFKPARCSSR